MTQPMPPNWRYNCHATYGKRLTYSSFPVSSASDEYAVICSLLDNVHVKSVEQVVNPTLSDKFLQRSKEMLKCKTNNAEALTAIGLDEIEVRETLAYTYDFEPHIEVAHVPFDHNMALLYHCTGNKNNIEKILSEGLDERLGNKGLIGRGIYFADDPVKSMSYDRCGGVIFIFGVLLGDCIAMDKNQSFTDFVREPRKEDDQKRHSNDLFFDSIAGKPDGRHNEFVIYNRYQCVPLYKVQYEKLSDTKELHSKGGMLELKMGGTQESVWGHVEIKTNAKPSKFNSYHYIEARKDYPEICWKKNGQYKHPMPSLIRLRDNDEWPFLAKKIFEKMGVVSR